MSEGIEEGESIKAAYELELKYGWETEYFEAIKAMEESEPSLYIVIPPVNKVLELQYMSDVIKISGNTDYSDLIAAYKVKYLSEKSRQRTLSMKMR